MDPALVQSLVSQIERTDLSTAAHTWRVVLYARALAEYFAFDAEQVDRITTAAALHDLGKIDIPAAILQKPARLTPDEFETVKTHAELGYRRLINLGVTDELVLQFVRFHHEAVDGSGYPLGLRADEIPIGPRYFSVIDSFDALTSIRPYRRDVGPDAAERALRELNDAVGSRYCAESVAAFEHLYRTGALAWILEYYNDAQAVPLYCGTPTALAAAKKG